MSANPVNSHALNVLLASEATFGTTPNPAASQQLELRSFSTGNAQQGAARNKQDRHPGRGMTNGFVHGRVPPTDFSLVTSCKSRAAAGTAAVELPIYRAAGILETLGATAVYTLPANPLSAAFAGLSALRALGHPTNSDAHLAEQLRGGVIKSLMWRGGDSELLLTANGVAVEKRHFGSADALSVIDGSTTTVNHTAAEGERLSVGWYKWESEIIYISAVGATSSTMARAQLSSSGAAHASAPLYPYVPAMSALTGVPISEATSTVTIDGTATRCTSFEVGLTTGMDLLPGETGSAYVQGAKAIRYDLTCKVGLVLKGNDVSLLGKVKSYDVVTLSLLQGTGAGSIATFSMPFAEVMPFAVPDTANDVAVVEIGFRIRDDQGNDAFTLTMS